MAKKQLEKTNKKLDTGKVFVKIMSFILAILMVLSVAATLIYSIIAM